MGKWGNGEVGEWGSGGMGKWGISTKTLKPCCRRLRRNFCCQRYSFLAKLGKIRRS
ncbi:MAG: hypothetical protein O9350_17470 [Microcystis sp. LE19-388.1G]|nr:hypothetical protein [Microcystis sp. LE19-388.1G]